jgi:hypothetical protein
MLAESTGSSCTTSSATAVNTSSAGAPRATSVATRRSAACSLASRAIPARLSAFEIAAASRSAKQARHASIPAGGARFRLDPVSTTPQTWPSTMIGTAAAERMPCFRASISSGPLALAMSVLRAGRPVRKTDIASAPPRGHRLPTGKCSPVLLQAATAVSESSESQWATRTKSTTTSRRTSSMTAANSSSAGAACATSVATRRNAACSSAS